MYFETSSEIGFRSGLEGLDLFGYNRNEIRYYRARTPYTQVFAVFGQKKEQYARLLHTQNVTRQWNIAVNMLRLRSDGFYQRQALTHNNLSLSSDFTSRNHRYSLLANGLVSVIKEDENGGISADSLFEGFLLRGKKFIPVRLDSARTRRGNREVTMKQFLNFGSKETVKKNDTVSFSRVIPSSALSYSFHFRDNWFVYDDKQPPAGYYKEIIFDSLDTHDSTRIFTLQNTVSWTSILFKTISAEVSYEQSSSRLRQYFEYQTDSFLAVDTLFRNDIVRLSISRLIQDKNFKGFYWNLDWHYVASGNHAGDYHGSGGIAYRFKGDKQLSLEYSSSYRAALFIYSVYSGNHFWWRNTFNNEFVSKTFLSYHDEKNRLAFGGGTTSITNYVYLDSTSTPVEFSGGDFLAVYSAYLRKDFRLKHFGLNNNITWQSVRSPYALVEENAIQIPSFVTNHSLYYHGNWFKGVTQVQFGFDVTYFSSYYADAYMPALGQYYVQHSQQMGNYPFIDFFFNMKVKHARIFFKTEHVNSGLIGPYYLAPHNPAPDRNIKFGINWVFYD